MQITTDLPVIGKIDHATIMAHLKSGQAGSLFNRFDAEELLAELKKARLVEDDKLPGDVIRLNSTVQVRDEKDKLVELTLVIPSIANIKERKISVMSPVGIALIGCRKGQQVVWRVPQGEKRFFIVDVK
jgi:regulator of nucleoside diphosphate kinase